MVSVWLDPQHTELKEVAVKKNILAIITLAVLILFPMQTITAQNVGDVIEFGGLSWQVLDVQDTYALIITENVMMIGTGQFNRFHSNITWANSSMRFYLNNEFLDNFIPAERARIRETFTITNNNPWYGTFGGGSIMDRVFLLSAEEVVRYFGDSGSWPNRPENRLIGWISDDYDSARRARDADGNAALWWLRTPGAKGNVASAIDPTGVIWLFGTGVTNSAGARPALWLRL